MRCVAVPDERVATDVRFAQAELVLRSLRELPHKWPALSGL
jgi:hypothetical protein